MTEPQQPPPSATVPLVTVAAMEAAVAPFMVGAYTTWLNEVSAAVLGGFNRFGLPPDPSAIWSTIPTWERIVEDLMGFLARIARAGWEDTARQLGVRIPFDPTDPILADQLQRTRNLMVRTPNEVYRQIIEALGRSAGQPVQRQAELVRQILDVTGTENWPARARTVAVTEVHRAWNFGALAAAQKAQAALNTALLKRWDAKEDSKTRPAHDRADGQTVALNQPFIVDFEPLMAPGDPAGRPDNVINCRCKPRFSRRQR